MKNLVVAFLSAFIVTASYSQYDPKALEILDAMSKKYRTIPSFEANISYKLSNEVEKINEEYKGKITVKGDKFRLVLPEQEVINNGITTWTYLPEAKEVNIDDFDPDSEDINPAKIFEMYKKGFKYVFLELESDATKDVVDLIPEKKDPTYFKIKMMISKKDKSVISFTMFDKMGSRFTYSITKFTPNIKIDDAVFTWDQAKYPGVEVVDLRN